MSIKRLMCLGLLVGVVAAPAAANDITPIPLGAAAIQDGSATSVAFGGAGLYALDWTLYNQTGRPWSDMHIVVQFNDPIGGWRDATPGDGFGLPVVPGLAVTAVIPSSLGVVTETFTGSTVVTDTLEVPLTSGTPGSPRSMTALGSPELVKWDYFLNGWMFSNSGASLRFVIPAYLPTSTITVTLAPYGAAPAITGTTPSPWRLQATPSYPTPEPATMLLFGAGGAALWLARRRKSD